MRTAQAFTALIMAFGLALPAPGHAENAVVTLVSGTAQDLTCPVSPKPPQPSVPSAPAQRTHMPTAAQLGGLARPVMRTPPVIDSGQIPAFALGGASPQHPRRVAIWGDSHIAAGPLAATIGDAVRDRGLTVGTRFLPPTMGRANVRLPRLHAYCIGPAWSTELAFQGAMQAGPDLANRVVDGGPQSYLWLDLRNEQKLATLKQVTIAYRAPQGGQLMVSVNDGPEQAVALQPGSTSQGLTVRSNAPIGTLKLRQGQGRLELQGFVLDEAAPPAVTFDVFGLPSSTVRGWANADPAYLAQALQGISYDAVILEYGTNEGNETPFNADTYAATLAQALTHVRAVFPQASCVLVGPPDRGLFRLHAGEQPDLLSYARIHQQIAIVQAQVGARFACAAWNWQDVMGGPGGSYGWALHAPPLMGPDGTHLTAEGYRQTGKALAHSLGW